MTSYDYVVVGAGSAGCVLAERLSADPANTVLLVEAGGSDRSPAVSMPKGFAFLLNNPRYIWEYDVESFGPYRQEEHWIRGKLLGGFAMFRRMREIVEQHPIADMLFSEIEPGRAVQDDESILRVGMLYGGTGYHASGGCEMGPSEQDPLDARLRVRGVSGLRVVDVSIMPAMVSGNLNGAVMAMAWRAAELMLTDR